MTSAFLRSYFWDRPELVKFVTMAAGVGDRGSEYSAEEREFWMSVDNEEHGQIHLNGDLKSEDDDPALLAKTHESMAKMGHGSMANMGHESMANMGHSMGNM
jgi:hypothetical protein